MGYYTYTYYRGDFTPYYVGVAARKDRVSVRSANHHPPRRPDGSVDYARVLKQSWISREEALDMEKWWIKFWGRKDIPEGSLSSGGVGHGLLRNLTDGGDGGDTFSGRKHTEDTKRKMRKPKPKGFGERVSARQLGIPKSTATKEKLKRIRSSQESRNAMSIHFKKLWSESRDKMMTAMGQRAYRPGPAISAEERRARMAGRARAKREALGDTSFLFGWNLVGATA